ncbi:MAG: 2,3-bisphosphoglycerate-independent phosphoglycerate mutase [Desulfobacteraceae bacterium]
MDLNLIKRLAKPGDTKIVLLVLDGVGGVPLKKGGLTELETAHTPYLDEIAGESICGLHQPVGNGITPGSGPAHLALFGYDPVQYQVGRGVLAALGIDFDLRNSDVAARGNFCTLDEEGRVTDRRAGRISSEKNQELLKRLRCIDLPGAELFLEVVKEYRFLLVLRGEGLAAAVGETDPHEEGKPPRIPEPLSPEAEHTAALVYQFLEQAREILADQHPANMVLLRGFSQRPQWPQFPEVFGLRPAGIAAYPMYRGLATLVGMEVLKAGENLQEPFMKLEKVWADFDFFFVHIKPTDSAGEDCDFDRKVRIIEEVDSLVPQLLRLNPGVVVITGDHSTPAKLSNHSWHPVPVLLWSRHCRADGVDRFGERACLNGGLGPRFPAVDLMPLALANAQRLEKFGA